MNWDSLFEMLKQFFSNDPTMTLLLTVGFFFLKTIWPTPSPASDQVLQGFVGRIRKALELGDQEAAKRLADEGISKTAEYLAKEAEPKPKGILDIFSGIFGNPTLMPLLLIGGVFLLLMLTGGGCKKTQVSQADWPPAAAVGQVTGDRSQVTGGTPIQLVRDFSGVLSDEIRNAVFDVDSAAGSVRLAGYEPGVSEWAWAGETEDGDAAGSRGDAYADHGASGGADEPGAACLAAGTWALAANCRSGQCRTGRPAVARTEAVPRLALRRGQPFRNAARGLARPPRWLRGPGRAVAWIVRGRR